MPNPSPPEALFLDRLPSPIGTMLVVHDAARLRALEFDDCEARLNELLRLHYGAYTLDEARAPERIRQSLARYFAGDLRAIECVEVATGGTPFQREVWAALRRIPAGTTMSYGGVALQIGRPRSVRAVGAANGDNPVSIVVPCHRVIGADGSLTGYGGGLARKRWLLTHEGAALKATAASRARDAIRLPASGSRPAAPDRLRSREPRPDADPRQSGPDRFRAP
ncbi:MAG: methylated-DNA--[protein]-cysteine S-methyltransferase [Acetobacteraceae bacterium]|nr:methylated-DNA--[protein]-cysteine S-methyltransferase [Acetobacteraceae bacterium]